MARIDTAPQYLKSPDESLSGSRRNLVHDREPITEIADKLWLPESRILEWYALARSFLMEVLRLLDDSGSVVL
jgi:hypothetical protein